MLHRVEGISPQAEHGPRLNVLTGTLLAAVDFIEGRAKIASRLGSDAVRNQFTCGYLDGLPLLLHRHNIRGFESWNYQDSTEPVSATVAWLIRVVGWMADSDPHLVMRMVNNLAAAIDSIPEDDGFSDRSW